MLLYSIRYAELQYSKIILMIIFYYFNWMHFFMCFSISKLQAVYQIYFYFYNYYRILTNPFNIAHFTFEIGSTGIIWYQKLNILIIIKTIKRNLVFMKMHECFLEYVLYFVYVALI